MRKPALCVVALMTLFLSSCSKEDAKQLTVGPPDPSLSERLDDLSRQQMATLNAHLQKSNYPQQVRQLSQSVLRQSQFCAKKRLIVTLDASINEKTFATFQKRFLLSQQECFVALIDQTNVLAGSDKAYEVNLSVRHFNPSFPVMMIPSYVIIDEASPNQQKIEQEGEAPLPVPLKED